MPGDLNPKIFQLVAETRTVDTQGRLLVLHHGTDQAFDRFSKTRDLGIHFGSRSQAQKRLADLSTESKIRTPGLRKRIISAVVNIQNPLIVPDDPIAWPTSYLVGLFRRFIPDAKMPQLAALIESRTPKGQQAVIDYVKGALIGAGFDGILYRNMIESARKSRTVDWSWCVFDANNIVVLGENLATDAIEIPDAHKSSFGPSPIPADPRQIPGLRRRNGNFVYKAEIQRFESQVTERLLAAGADRQEPGYGTVRLRIDLADDSGIIAEIMPDLGRVMLIPDAENPYEAMKHIEICDDHGPVRKGCDRGLCFEWMPGETIDDTLVRVERAIESWTATVTPDAVLAYS